MRLRCIPINLEPALGSLRRVTTSRYIVEDVSELYAAAIFRVEVISEARKTKNRISNFQNLRLSQPSSALHLLSLFHSWLILRP
jgi:hypothetical protein